MEKNKILREELCLNRGWLFHDGDIVELAADGHKKAYLQSKTRSTTGVISQDFNDSDWQPVNLPHDFVTSRTPVADVPGWCGCRKRGVVWYRRHFKLEDSDRGKNIELLFEGASTLAKVYFNGAPVVSSECGYTSFRCDVTPMAEYGACLNTIAVRVDAESAHEGWWYEGGGLYRDVWLIKRSACHFLTDGIYANPVKGADSVWHIPFEAEIGNTGMENNTVKVLAQLIAPDGNVIASMESSPAAASLFQTTKISMDMTAPADVALWDLDTPVLYTVKATLLDEKGVALDVTNVRCGFRTIAFDPDHGFFLNGRHVKFYGTCNHQDHAGVGVAVPKSIERFRLLKLKEMGCNAYRCAHNPPSKSLLDLCDELGIMVMDETRHYSTAEVYLDQLVWLVKRDRNHPSVVLWSILNEETPLAGRDVGYEMARKMCGIIKNLDKTRFTTGAMNGGYFSDLNATVPMDVTGINYWIHSYDPYREFCPKKCIVSSEDASGLATRGEVITNKDARTLADNDSEAVPWGANQRKAWREIDTRPWMAGCFVWTGFDYRGEPTPYPFPANSSYFGLLDLCGFPKNSFYVRQAWWRKDLNVLKIATHWNRDVEAGTPLQVLVISSNAATVELSLNGRVIGKQPTDYYEMNTFEVPYEPGVLKAVSYTEEGYILAQTSIETTGPAVALKLIPDRTQIADDAYDTIPVTVCAVDAAGRTVPNANNPVRFSILGDGVIKGVGNGDPTSLESELAPERKLFNGLAQVLIQATVDGRGKITLHAEADGLASAETVITILPGTADRKYVGNPPRFRAFTDWIRSSFFKEKPDPNLFVGEDDMNSWERITPGPGILFTAKDEAYMLFRATLPDEDLRGKSLIFRNLWGKAEVYYGGKLLASKPDYYGDVCRVKLPEEYVEDRLLTLILEADLRNSGAQLGFHDQVILEEN
ncbi:MAG: glycoside hydrolase family 2 protein [Lentisphaerae bacterium]|nr:glycoside hydrolase family 2 protein [Lentisphaerota bacterium]